MNSKELHSLYEAYQNVYSEQELTEEVEIAAQYFYNLGLNEEGVNIVIEELGVEEFGEYVYDLAEEYCLTEATETRLQARGSLKGPKGSKPQSVTKARVKAQGGTKMTASGGTGSTIKKDRPKKVAAAVEKAKEEQPKKKSPLDRVARPILKAMDSYKKGKERHDKAVAQTKETIGKAAKGAGHVAREFGKGVGAVAKIGKKVLTGEEVDLYDMILDYLVTEGFADTDQDALVIMANMSEEWRDSIVEGMTMKDFKQQRSRQKQKEKRAAEKLSPTRRKNIHTDRYSPERAARHRANVDPDFEGNDERNYPGGKLKNPKKIRKAKALGELGEEVIDEAIRNPESRKKLRAIMDKEVRKGDKSKGENPRSKYSTEKGNLASHLLHGPESTGSKGNPVRSRGGTNAPADERVGRGPHRASNAAYWARNAGPNRDRGSGNKSARRAGKSVPNTRDED